MDRTEGSRRGIDFLLGAAAVAVLLLVFFASWWNRYLSPASGGEIAIAFLFERGMLPYRDYFVSAPPGMVLAIAEIDRWFGRELLPFWAIGVVVRLVGAMCLYVWLCRVVRLARNGGRCVSYSTGDGCLAAPRVLHTLTQSD